MLMQLLWYSAGWLLTGPSQKIPFQMSIAEFTQQGWHRDTSEEVFSVFTQTVYCCLEVAYMHNCIH